MKITYVIYNDANQSFKVGYASNLNQRFSCIQLATSDTLTLLFVFQGGLETEKELHKLLRNYKIRGEWFIYNQGSLDILLSYQKQQLSVLTHSKEDIIPLTFDETIIKVASSIKKKFTIAELKRKLPSLLMSSKEVEAFLLNNGWEMTQYGSCRTKFFSKVGE